MAWTPPRRIVSQPTTITVVAVQTGLPSWIPAAGSWGNVNLPSSTPKARADATLAGTHGTGGYFASGRFGGQNPWNDYTGGMWNPFLSTYGAWCVRGGGHATSRSMLDTGTYVWNTGDRLWERYTDPVYPGDVPVEVPGYGWAGDDQRTNGPAWYDFNLQTLPSPKWDVLKLYGEVTANATDGYVPAADHNRYMLIFVRPGLWGMGPKGGIFLPAVNSYGVDQGGASWQAHIFSFDTRKWSRVGDWRAMVSPKIGTSGCIDWTGNVYHWEGDTYAIRRLQHNASTWSTLSISNLVGTFGSGLGAMVWVPGWAVKNTGGAVVTLAGYTGSSYSPQIRFCAINLDSGSLAAVLPGGGNGLTGTQPVFPGSPGDSGAGCIWVDDIGALVFYSASNKLVYAIYPPSSPFTQNWTCSVIASSNSPTINTSQLPNVYNKFQYAPALKSFFIVGKADNDDMWCFRPADSYFRLWAPEPGEYADISLTTAKLTAGVDPCPANNCIWTAQEGQSAIWRDWNGFAFSPELGSMGSMLLHGGGHDGYYGNEVLRYDIATRAFTRLNSPSPYSPRQAPGCDVYGAFPDGGVNPLHTYNNFEYVPPDAGGGTLGSVVFTHRPNSNSTVTYHPWWRFDIATAAWSRGPDSLASRTTQIGTNRCALVYDSKRKGVWRLDFDEYAQQSLGLCFYSLVTGQQYALDLNSGNTFKVGAGSGTNCAMVTYNARRDFLLVFHRVPNVGTRQLVCIDLSSYTLGVTPYAPAFAIDQQGTPHPLVVTTEGQERLEYCSYDGNFYAVNWPIDARLYKLTVPTVLTDPWVWSSEVLAPKSGTTAVAFESPARSNDNCLYGKFRYVPSLKSFMWSDGQDLKVQAGRPSLFK